ncbi:Phosphofructokinase [Artemisia annua]|uniref:Phosphofructokinase n=1 Tax=Artemisia annua TaxID=35608 RepID=A0A2U1L010_ARTAN|nr:Phosphofructokinase [Artemisia annua]
MKSPGSSDESGIVAEATCLHVIRRFIWSSTRIHDLGHAGKIVNADKTIYVDDLVIPDLFHKDKVSDLKARKIAFKEAQETVKRLDLDGLVVIGGDDSNTNACLLAENFKANDLKTRVIGCPKTIDG